MERRRYISESSLECAKVIRVHLHDYCQERGLKAPSDLYIIVEKDGSIHAGSKTHSYPQKSPSRSAPPTPLMVDLGLRHGLDLNLNIKPRFTGDPCIENVLARAFRDSCDLHLSDEVSSIQQLKTRIWKSRQSARIFSAAIWRRIYDELDWSLIKTLPSYVGSCRMSTYNACAQDNRLFQLYQTAPLAAMGLQLCDLPPDLLNQPLREVMLELFREGQRRSQSNKLAEDIILSRGHSFPFQISTEIQEFNLAAARIAVQRVRYLPWYVGSMYPGLVIQRMAELTWLDHNRLRKLTRASQWKVLFNAMARNIHLADRLLDDENFDRVIIKGVGFKKEDRIQAGLSNLMDALCAGAITVTGWAQFPGLAPKLPSPFPDLPRMSARRLWGKQIEWHAEQARARATQNAASRAKTRQDIEERQNQFPPVKWLPLIQNDDYIFEYLDNEIKLFDEGIAMDHCVWDYTKRTLYGTCYIYSLRKAETNEPVATVELDETGRQIRQIQGFSNTALPNKVHTTVKRFVDKLHPPKSAAQHIHTER